MEQAQLAAALDKIAERIGIADRAFDEWAHKDDDWARGSAEWHLGLAFVQLLALTESLGLHTLRGEIASVCAQAQREGFSTGEVDPNVGPYLKWALPARRYWAALHGNFASEPLRTITKDLESILRDATYSITDVTVFRTLPANESEVHQRIENLLRPVFPDLVHKPRLAKPIKNFEPDSGIPSIQTLIEYKFLSSKDQVSKVADEVLADTRGYSSKQWTSFIYCIYETERFRSESQWRELLRECAVEPSTTLVVMSGKAPSRAAKAVSKKPATRRKQTEKK